MNTHICPGCKEGKIDVAVHNAGSITHIKLDCTWCLGIGKLDDDRLQDYKEFHNVWCRCDNVGHNVKHYEDGVHPDMRKHHWRHTVCGKVVQIG
jgi:hypothetical protein